MPPDAIAVARAIFRSIAVGVVLADARVAALGGCGKAGGILVAGDALGTSGGSPTLPNASFTVDMDEARRSIAKLGRLTFETLLVGHGDPITSGASAKVATLGG